MKTKSLIFCSIFTIVFLLVFGLSQSNAAIPYSINYQGYLTDSIGAPVNGTVSMTFALYTVATGGTAIWTEAQNVDVTGGIYSVILGSVSTLTPLAFDVPYWLGVRVGSDAEMTPRVQFTSVGYAFTSDMAMDLVCPGCVNFSDIGQNGCTANQFMMWSGTAWTCSTPSGITENDPKVGTLTPNLWCRSNAGGTAIDCTTAAPITSETDPKVGALNANLWCHSNAGATAIVCDAFAPPPAAHDHDTTYVNVTGDAMTGALTVQINTTSRAILGQNAGSGPGLLGDSTSGFGVEADGGGDGDQTDAIGDLLLGGNNGEIIAEGSGDMALLSNRNVQVYLDRNADNNAYFGVWDDTAVSAVFTVRETGEVSAQGTVSGYGIRVRAGARPACDSSVSGLLWFTSNSPTKDVLELCADSGAGYGWQPLY